MKLLIFSFSKEKKNQSKRKLNLSIWRTFILIYGQKAERNEEKRNENFCVP